MPGPSARARGPTKAARGIPAPTPGHSAPTPSGGYVLTAAQGRTTREDHRPQRAKARTHPVPTGGRVRQAGEVLRTGRLLLRTWRLEDRELFAQMNADPEVMAFFVSPMTRTESDALVDRIEAGFTERGFGLWAVEQVETGSFIGFAGLLYQTFQAPFTPAFEISYRLARREWGKGYATEAGREVLRYGFEEAGLAEVISMTAAQNARSRAVMTKLGLRHDPVDDFDHPLVPDGHPIKRHVLYRLTGQQWRQEMR